MVRQRTLLPAIRIDEGRPVPRPVTEPDTGRRHDVRAALPAAQTRFPRLHSPATADEHAHSRIESGEGDHGALGWVRDLCMRSARFR